LGRRFEALVKLEHVFEAKFDLDQVDFLVNAMMPGEGVEGVRVFVQLTFLDAELVLRVLRRKGDVGRLDGVRRGGELLDLSYFGRAVRVG
jgi:hypothetical protein